MLALHDFLVQRPDLIRRSNSKDSLYQHMEEEFVAL